MIQAAAVVFREPGDPGVLEVDAVEVRDPGFGEVRVRVHAAGLNRADLLQRRGLYPAPSGYPSNVLGLEFAGEIESCGPGAMRRKAGDRVMGIVGGGGMAEYVCLHERELVPVPANLKWEEAAAIPEVFLTAYDALFREAHLSVGEWVLVHAAGSGVGSAAVQLAHASGARVIGTSRSPEKLAKVEALGLQASLPVADGTFADRCRALTDHRGVDVILDLVGAAYLAENLAALAEKGRMVIIGLLGGPAESLPLATVMAKRVTLKGSVLRARPLEEKIALARDFEARVVPLFDEGKLKPVVDAVFPVELVRAAHERMERNENVGKIVITFAA